MMQADKTTSTPLLNTKRVSDNKVTMSLIGLFSTAGYFSMFFQQCKKDGKEYETSEVLMHTALSIGLLYSLMMIAAKNYKGEAENVGEMSRIEYAKYIANRMFKPHVDPRRSYAFGTLLSNIVLLPGDILCFGNLVTERLILQSLYTVLQFTALTVPKDSANSFLAWGITKGAFQLISLAVVAKNPQEFAATIAANVCFTVAALTAITSGTSTKCAAIKEPVSDGLGV